MSGLKVKLKRSLHGFKGRGSGDFSPSSARKSGDFETTSRHSEDLVSSPVSTSHPGRVEAGRTIRAVQSDLSSHDDEHEQEKFSTPIGTRSETPIQDHPLPPVPAESPLDFGFQSSQSAPATEQRLPGFDHRDHGVPDEPAVPSHRNGTAPRGQPTNGSDADRAAAGPSHSTPDRSVMLRHPKNSRVQEKPLPPAHRSGKSVDNTEHLAQGMGDMNLTQSTKNTQAPVEPKGLRGLPPGFATGNSEDTTYDVEQAPAVTHEVIHHQVHEILEEHITREIHVDHIYNYVQPITVIEVAPAQHFALDAKTGKKIRIPTPEGWQMPDGTLHPRSHEKDWTNPKFAPQDFHVLHAAHQDNMGASPGNARYLQQMPTRS